MGKLYISGSNVIFVDTEESNVEVVDEPLDIVSLGDNWYELDFDIECMELYGDGVSITNAYIRWGHVYCRVFKARGRYFIKCDNANHEWSLHYTRRYFRGYKDSDYWNSLLSELDEKLKN